MLIEFRSERLKGLDTASLVLLLWASCLLCKAMCGAFLATPPCETFAIMMFEVSLDDVPTSSLLVDGLRCPCIICDIDMSVRPVVAGTP